MTYIDALRSALRALRANLMRSALTMLGIVIGVAAVILVVAIGSGAREVVVRQIRSLVRPRHRQTAVNPEGAHRCPPQGMPPGPAISGLPATKSGQNVLPCDLRSRLSGALAPGSHMRH